MLSDGALALNQLCLDLVLGERCQRLVCHTMALKRHLWMAAKTFDVIPGSWCRHTTQVPGDLRSLATDLLERLLKMCLVRALADRVNLALQAGERLVRNQSFEI